MKNTKKKSCIQHLFPCHNQSPNIGWQFFLPKFQSIGRRQVVPTPATQIPNTISPAVVVYFSVQNSNKNRRWKVNIHFQETWIYVYLGSSWNYLFLTLGSLDSLGTEWSSSVSILSFVSYAIGNSLRHDRWSFCKVFTNFTRYCFTKISLVKIKRASTKVHKQVDLRLISSFQSLKIRFVLSNCERRNL